MSSDDAKSARGDDGEAVGAGADGRRGDFFDLAGSDAELLNSGRIPDPQPGHTALFRWMARVLTAAEARLRARGGTGMRSLIRLFWGLLAAIGAFLLIGPIINKPLDIDDILASAKIETVDWVARDVQIDYDIDRGDDGEFAAQVSERFTAHFLNDVSADAVRRAVVTEFRGQDVRFQLHSATVDGAEAEVAVVRNPTMTTISLGRADGAPLDGQHEITLEYELHNLATPRLDDATGSTVDQWSWPIFASWPQATAGIEVSLTFSPEVDEAMIRQPRAYVGWLLISATAQLDPEVQPDGSVRYSFSEDQNMPPNADFWVHATFAAGTFVVPPTTSLFWWQSWGPLLPLGLLGVILLFALAARRVVWADSAGDPWYVPRSEPIDDLPPELAARLLRRARHAELVGALTSRPRPQVRGGRKQRAAQSTEEWVRGAARVGRRTGRVGNLPSVWSQRLRWAGGKSDPVIDRQLRWIPSSYVRDTFVLAPIAITLIQWGLLRQLSHQVILSVVWWPAVFVLVSTALAVTTIAAVTRPRPLTREGALAVQRLKGIDVYARATRLLERGPLEDPLMPYAVLFEKPRRAGDAVTELAVRETGDRGVMRGWRNSRFVSPAAMLALVASVAVFAGAVVCVSTTPDPYSISRDAITRHDDLPGTFYSQVTGFEIEAELSRDADGHARLTVVERNTVDFYPDGGQVPQFAREWPANRLGQDLGISDVSMRIDGETVPVRVGEHREKNSTYAVTQLPAALDGVHEVVVSYTLASPVVAVRSGPEDIEQLRWTAWYFFWEDEYYVQFGDFFGDQAPVRPIRLQLAIAPDLVDAVRQGGWIDYDHDRSRVPDENGNWFQPWIMESTQYVGDSEPRQRYELRLGSVLTRADGALVVEIDVDEAEWRTIPPYDAADQQPGPWLVDDELNAEIGQYELGLGGDLGVRLDFRAGTFADVSPEAYDRYRVAYAAPYILLLVLAGLVTVASVGVMVFASRLSGRGQSGSAGLAVLAFLAVPLIAIAQCVLFFWTIGSMAGDDSRIPGAMILGGIMLIAVIVQCVFAARVMGSQSNPSDDPGASESGASR